MGTGLWLLIAGGVLVVLLVAWPKLKAILPASWTGAVTNAIATASDATTDAVTAGAEQTLVIAGWVNGDLEYIQLVYACRKRREGWNVTPPTVTTATPTVTLDAISARLANIEAKLPPTTGV
jgi:hypothetical protein